MAKKKAAESVPEATAPAMHAAPGAMPGYGMPQPQMGMPGMMPGMPMPGMMPGLAPAGGNPMMAMMQMMQMMMGGGVAPQMIDPAAAPFGAGAAVDDGNKGLDSEIIRPALLDNLIKEQHAVATGSVLDVLCLTNDRQNALGGIPKGCTIAMAGPPGKGKTRTALAGLCRVAATGQKVAFIVAEEGFHNSADSGRDDLCSRLVKIGMAATGQSEADFVKQTLSNVYVLESQYHKGQTWDDFVTKYRYLIEKEKIAFVVIDSLNMLDPSRNRTADNLSALKTYNHQQGVTCLCIGQIRDTGDPVGGESLKHTADAVFLIEEFSLGSKEIAEQWGGAYRDRIDVIRAAKSVTTPIFPHMIRIDREPVSGVMTVHASQPAAYKPLASK